MIVRLVVGEAVAFLGGSSDERCAFRLLLLLFQAVVVGAAVSNTLLTTPALYHGTAIRSVLVAQFPRIQIPSLDQHFEIHARRPREWQLSMVIVEGLEGLLGHGSYEGEGDVAGRKP